MALVDPTTWQQWANKTIAPTELPSLTYLCAQTDTAIKTKLKRNIERKTYTDIIVDAPFTPRISLFRYTPIVISGFTCYLNRLANGDPTQFTSQDLLTMYTDYTLDPDPEDPTLCSSGRLTKTNSYWGIDFYRPNYSMAVKTIPVLGAVKLTFTGGYEQVPNDIQLAACLAVSKLRNSRRYGAIPGSESWNGYSYSLSAGDINEILNSDAIEGLLSNYMNYPGIIG